MFEDALLDSSLRHTSVLHRIHYLLSAFTGMLVFAVGMFVMPLLLPAATERALMTAASILDALATLYALMICYVWVDARQQHWWAWPWLGVALLLNLPGFLIYLVYYARKTGDWKRAAMPLAYVAESLLVGVLILVPLIYTQALPNQFLITEIHISPPPGRPPAPRPATPPRPMPHRPTLYPMVSPVSIPPTIARISEPPEPPKVGVSPGSYVPGVPVGLGGRDLFQVEHL